MIRNKRKVKIGLVSSDRMDKTVVVRVERMVFHPLLKKRVKKTSKFKVHNPENKARMGDKIRIAETRPLSKDKHWRVAEILQRAEER